LKISEDSVLVAYAGEKVETEEHLVNGIVFIYKEDWSLLDK